MLLCQLKRLQFAPAPRFLGMITPQEIDEWLKSIGQKRSWLAQELDVSAATVKGWLSAGRPITGAALKLLQRLMQPTPVLNPDFTLDEWEQIETLAKAEGISPREWITRVLKREISSLPKISAHTVNAGQTTSLVQAAHSFGHTTLESEQKATGTDDDDVAPKTSSNSSSGRGKKKSR